MPSTLPAHARWKPYALPVVCVCGLLGMAGCGQKGPLFIPIPPAPVMGTVAAQPATPALSAPVPARPRPTTDTP